MQIVVEKLIKLNKTISTMESCTGGALVNEITNIEGSSKVLKYSAVTYSNEFKTKMGVPKDTIDKYSVYSLEVAIEMSKQISLFSNSNYGIGITGKLSKPDENNLYGSDNRVFVSIYDKDADHYHTITIDVNKKDRRENKQMIVNIIIDALISLIK